MSKPSDGQPSMLAPYQKNKSFLDEYKNNPRIAQAAEEHESDSALEIARKRNELAVFEEVIDQQLRVITSPDATEAQKKTAAMVAQLTSFKAQISSSGLLIDCLTVKEECKVKLRGDDGKFTGEVVAGYRRVPISKLIDNIELSVTQALLPDDDGNPGELLGVGMVSIDLLRCILMANYMAAGGSSKDSPFTLIDENSVPKNIFEFLEQEIANFKKPVEAGRSKASRSEVIVEEGEGVAYKPKKGEVNKNVKPSPSSPAPAGK